MDAFTRQILKSPGYIGHANRIRPYMRPMPVIRHMTSVLDSEVVCTLCRGGRVTITEHHNGLLEYEPCENCFDPKTGRSTGFMKSRTSEEQWGIDRRPRI